MYKSIVLVVLISVISCSQEQDEKLGSIELKPSRSIGNSDSIYFSQDVWEIVASRDKLTVFDNKAQKVYWFTRNLELEKVVDIYGQGPGELLGTHQAVSKNGYLIIADEGKRQFHLFDNNGDWIKSITPFYRDNFLNDFAVDDSFNFYYSSRLGESPIIKTDSLSNPHKDFVVITDSHSEVLEENHLNEYRVFMSDDDQILAVGVSTPIVYRYELNGDLIETLDLSDFFEYRTEKKEEIFAKDPNLRKIIAFAYFNDVIYHHGKLYLLYIGDYEIPNSNQVLVVSDKPSLSLETNIDLKLEGAFFKRICIFNDNLIAFDRASTELVVFDLK